MKSLILIMQILVSWFLMVVILLQARGTGLGRAWGGTGMYYSKRGLEKLLFRVTLVMAGLFLVVSVLGLVI